MKHTARKVLLMHAGLALAFALTSPGSTYAADPAAVEASAPAEPIDAALPQATPEEEAAAKKAEAKAEASPEAQAATTPAPASSETPAYAVPPESAATTPQGAPVAAETSPASPQAGNAADPQAAIAPQPSDAELAIAKNAAALDTMAPTPPAAQASPNTKENGLGFRVTDMLPTPAVVRPLPQDYLVVKKERNVSDTDARLLAARGALAQGHYQAALELFDDLYRKNARDMRVMMGRAVTLQKLGQADEAMEAYQTALAYDPHSVEALTNMLGLLKGQDAPMAVTKLQQLRDLYPANADIAAQLGTAYGQTGDYAKAIKYLDMADALKPGSATVLYNKAVAYDHMGKTGEAANLYRKIVLLASDGSLDRNFPIEDVRERLATIR